MSPSTPASSPFEQLALDLTPRYGAGEARSVARILLEDAFGAKTLDSFRLANTADEQRFLDLRERLLRGEPVQYVLGEADFLGLKFEVSPAVLIPRQETEELVVWAAAVSRTRGLSSARVLDVGLGSGCLGIALARRQRGVHLCGLEKSPDALALARRNAQRLLQGQAVDFRLGDALDFNLDWAAEWGGAFDLVVSNPPYIPEHERGLMPEHVLEHEPAMALFVPDHDALLFYRAIARQAQRCLRPGGALLFECNEFNAGEVAALLRTAGFANVELRHDLSGAERMVGGTWLGG
jgi:release factor glutamine methyltransferase